jgi:subtilase family serine protease
VTIPTDTAKRKYFILAVADGDLAIAELNENNNVKTKGVTVR